MAADVSGGGHSALPALVLGNDPSIIDYIAHICSSRGSLSYFEIGFVDSQGIPRALEMSMTPIMWRGSPASLCALIDRSKELLHQRGLREVNAALEARSVQRAAELTRAQRELQAQEKLASLGSMVAGVAHELNTPIGNARLTASTLLESTEKARAMLASGSVRKSDLHAHFASATEAGSLLMGLSIAQANSSANLSKFQLIDPLRRAAPFPSAHSRVTRLPCTVRRLAKLVLRFAASFCSTRTSWLNLILDPWDKAFRT